jgi:hypothetical protein
VNLVYVTNPQNIFQRCLSLFKLLTAYQSLDLHQVT